MEKFKVNINVKNNETQKIIETAIEKYFLVSNNIDNCDVFLTDNPSKNQNNKINILIAEYKDLSQYKGNYNFSFYNHYIIYNEPKFLEERIQKVLWRQYQIRKKIDHKTKEITGAHALINAETSKIIKGISLPIFRQFKIRSSDERRKMADELENFFTEIESIIGTINPRTMQYAIEIQEELLMNAIWDANPKHVNKSRKEIIELNEEEVVNLEWAFNGKELAISVKDFFGRLESDVMQKYVNFIFKTGKPISHSLAENKMSAGLGMYMIMQRANLLSVFVNKGVVTDVGVVLIIGEGKLTKSSSTKAIDIINV